MNGLRGLLAALLVSAFPNLQADDWARFRGPGGLGLHPPAQVPLSPDPARPLWKVATKGSGHSSPIIQGEKLFFTIAPDDDPDVRDLVCLSVTDGRELWRRQFAFAEYVLHQFNSAASTTPAADAERIYLWWNDGEGSQVMALDHDGEALWETALGPFESEHGCGSSLALAGDVLLVQKENLGPESFIAGLQPDSGKILWKTPVPTKTKTPYVTPLIRPTGIDQNLEAIFASTDHGMFALDPQTGAFRWRFPADFEHRVVASPVMAGDYLFASCGGGGGGKSSVVLKAPPGATEVTEAYRPGKWLPYVPTGVGIDGRFYFVSDGGVGTCYDAQTGELLWRERLVSKCFASLIAVGPHIYAFGRDGDYKVFRASATFEPLAEGKFPSGIQATPAVGAGKLFVRCEDTLYCFQEGPSA